MGSDGQRFRIIISGEEQTAAGRPRQQSEKEIFNPCGPVGLHADSCVAEVIDFDLASVTIHPQYAMPTSNGATLDMILRRDEKIARLTFMKMSHIMKFQQCITGFKTWASYSQYNAIVRFVVTGHKEPFVEQACVQLWIPKSVDGSIVTSTDMVAEGNESPVAVSSLAPTTTLATPFSSRPESRNNSVATTDIYERNSESAIQGPRMDHYSMQATQQQQQQQQHRSSMLSPRCPSRFSPPPAVSPVPSSGTSGSRMMLQPRGQLFGTSYTAQLLPSPHRFGYTSTNRTNGKNTRGASSSLNIPTAVTIMTPTANISSSSNGYTVTIPTGPYTTGSLHVRPPKPMLVLFTRSLADGELSLVTIQIDEETAVNPERCDCRRIGREGLSCRIAAVERRRGKANLEARRFDVSGSGETGWNAACLSLNNPSSRATTWPSLNRVSITFPHPEDRAKFGGTPNQCRCTIKNDGDMRHCLGMGHMGLWGEVQEFHRRRCNEFHMAKCEKQQQVVYGQMSC